MLHSTFIPETASLIQRSHKASCFSIFFYFSIFIYFVSRYLKRGIHHQVPNTPHPLHLKMAPSSDDNIKNIGSAHLTTLVVLSNPRSCGQGLTIALDLHLLLKSPEGEAIEKTVLARLYNHTKISFTAPRVCFVSVSVRPSPPFCSLPL